MKSSFTATTPGGVQIRWDSQHGFSGPLGPTLNQDMQTAPLQTIRPQAEIARTVLLNLLPGCTITDFVSAPLPKAKGYALV